MHISSQVEIVKNILNNIKKDNKYDMIELINSKRIQLKIGTRIFINGEWLGLTLKPIELYEYFKQCRIIGQIDKTVSIILDNFNNEIRLNCDGGRMYRPLLIVKKNSLILNNKMLEEIELNENRNNKDKILNWNDFIYKYNNAVEYIDVEEAEMTMVAMYPTDIQREYKKMNKIIENPNINGSQINRYDDTLYVEYTHCELHPMLMLGVVSSNIPFLNHNQSPRNYYSFAQTRQGISIYSTNYKNRNDLSYIMYNPQIPLVKSVSTNYTNMIHMPYGINCIVAIACYTGYNQEDSIIINKSALDRGLFRTVTFKKYTAELKKNSTTTQDDEFLKPDRKITASIKEGNYEKLNNEGYIPEETEIENGDIIIGKVSPIQGDADKKYIDQSEIFKSNVNGYVDKVFICFNSDEHKMYNMRVRSERYPMIGDKFAAVHGQKGTIGLILDSADMPFTESGMQPDIIINPNAIPSRMTIGQLIECIVGKASAIQGIPIDGTPFNNYDTNDACKILEKNGYKGTGEETMYCGLTGKKMNSKIFIGPTYYMRLKHMVQDKIHARAKGPQQLLTRQAPDGRAKDGGLRFGEMERDSIISHGLSYFLKEKLLDSSDKYEVWVCNGCGKFAQKMIDKNIYICKECKNTETSKVTIPYAFKLLIQELMSINILPAIRPELIN